MPRKLFPRKLFLPQQYNVLVEWNKEVSVQAALPSVKAFLLSPVAPNYPSSRYVARKLGILPKTVTKCCIILGLEFYNRKRGTYRFYNNLRNGSLKNTVCEEVKAT